MRDEPIPENPLTAQAMAAIGVALAQLPDDAARKNRLCQLYESAHIRGDTLARWLAYFGLEAA